MGQNFKWKLDKYFDKQQAMNTVYFIVARNFNSLNLLYTGLIWRWNIFVNFVFSALSWKLISRKCHHATPFSCPCGLFRKNIFFCKSNFGAFLQRIFHRQNKLVYGIKLLISLYICLVLLNNYVMPHTLFVKYFKIIIPLQSFLLKLHSLTHSLLCVTCHFMIFILYSLMVHMLWVVHLILRLESGMSKLVNLYTR